jgi:hypothetical protein
MRLNAKVAKELRAAAQYRNQTATPSTPKFPGVARLYSMPVYMTRPAMRSSYVSRNGEMVKLWTKATAMHVIGRKGKEPIIPILMEHDAKTQEMTPKLELVPVTRPITVTDQKKIYRALKRLNRRGLLAPAGLEQELKDFVRSEGHAV